LYEIGEPVSIDAHVGVGVRDDLAGCSRETDVPCRAQSAVGHRDKAHGISPGNVTGRISGAVIDDDDLEVGVVEAPDRVQAILEGVGSIVGADDNRDPGPRLHAGFGERRRRNRRADLRQRRLGFPICIDEAERPVFDLVASAPPLVGPREGHRAAESFLERRADVHRGDRGLPVGSLADAVGACLRKEQRTRAGDLLQSREVCAQVGFAVQIDVERADVEAVELEIFRRRVVHIRQQAMRRCGPGVGAQVLQKARHALVPVPAHDGRRNLIADREQQCGRMRAKHSDVGRDLAPNIARQPRVVQKRHVLRPGQTDHDAKPVLRRLVQQCEGGDRVGADRVEPGPCHEGEVRPHLL